MGRPYATVVGQRSALARGAAAFLQKPFTASALAVKVREILDAVPASP